MVKKTPNFSCKVEKRRVLILISGGTNAPCAGNKRSLAQVPFSLSLSVSQILLFCSLRYYYAVEVNSFLAGLLNFEDIQGLLSMMNITYLHSQCLVHLVEASNILRKVKCLKSAAFTSSILLSSILYFHKACIYFFKLFNTHIRSDLMIFSNTQGMKKDNQILKYKRDRYH